ncbi:hypothetical protein BAE44_0013418 [Dichanthelium oligosanthes]|uniref:Uncharacterized protein n=1 Tax=Dichanthelium oligosanthes TaxID=888268 RepID=A0A1E5VKC8_9POAL|nr:hypothetical protein BAE44_0013418 [Dichanthelium oligosanthes]
MPSPSSSSPPSAPAAAATRRRQRRRQLLPSSSSSSSTVPASSTSGPSASSASSSSTSSSSASSSGGLSFSFPSFSPAPSPFHHRFLSPLRASAVPFSWEHRPGIPKTPARQTSARGAKSAAAAARAAAALPLPLPPSLLSSKVGAADDPFSAEGYLIVPDDVKARRRRQRQQRRRPPALASTLTDWLAVLSLYRSCTRSRDCLAAGTPPPRPRSPAKAV